MGTALYEPWNLFPASLFPLSGSFLTCVCWSLFTYKLKKNPLKISRTLFTFCTSCLGPWPSHSIFLDLHRSASSIHRLLGSTRSHCALQPGNCSLSKYSYRKITSILSPLSSVIVHRCLMSCVFKLLFNIFCPFESFFQVRQEGRDSLLLHLGWRKS